jgi:hypothetical protein
MLRYRPLRCLLLSYLFIGCQQEQKSPARTPPVPRSSAEPLLGLAPPATAQLATQAQSAVPQTLYPDTLHPRALAYQVWTTAEVDTMQGERLPVADARYRVLDVSNTPTHGDEPSLRFFCRAPNAPARWWELDLRNPLSEFMSDLYLAPQTIDLDQRPPAELLLRLGGRNDGNAAGTGLGYTLLLSLANTPTVVWQSIDSCQQTIRPLLTAADTTEETSFTRGYSEDEAHRRVTVRRGVVQVSRISQDTTNRLGEENLTPITPGRYRYQAGRFQRVVSESARLKSEYLPKQK